MWFIIFKAKTYITGCLKGITTLIELFASRADISSWLMSTPVGNLYCQRPGPTFLGTQKILKSVVALYAEGIHNKPLFISIQWFLWSESSQFSSQWMPLAGKVTSTTTASFVWYLSWDTVSEQVPTHLLPAVTLKSQSIAWCKWSCTGLPVHFPRSKKWEIRKVHLLRILSFTMIV